MMIPASAQAAKRFQIYIFQIFLFHGLYRSYERVNLLFCCEEAEREPNGALKGSILQMPVDQSFITQLATMAGAARRIKVP